ncbi:MAG TPA: alpha-L-arabinofuranosidase C-terminal domain-containing protein [Bacteroidales bacterium]|nr:alpha-N-arabinofuranosidase [Bacteroidales bacterium]HCI54660.1 alpha-N-arabinofuranosidase [Bacteroidales bacterium]HOU96047.1 alpha-L-arabinofuranosidase C-terminal domain-containing protein [Bacteroidales bacterium]HQG36447.1 alpha-L-arabinofuranosidase C-terminal domain-containing protein [Bacteroidales bacterium]HQG52526.1 alpha-L-arabinofuranosidase C-terminal domain-containing protein [Bacteroidales bacterium]
MKKILLLFFLTAISLNSFSQTSVAMTVDAGASKYTISRHIYGHFSEHLGRCIYDGYWVDPSMPVPKQDRIRLDIVDALKKIKIPNLRWPGGCFADEYHWRDGIGPRNQRPTMINTNWGNVTEDNSFGTHEYLLLCELIGAEPFIVGNLGSGTVEEMSKWIEYLNFDGISPMTNLRKQNGREKPWGVTWFGVGNENWGCGGNMTPEYYVTQYRQYATFIKNYPGTAVRKIASGANSGNYNWTDVLMAGLAPSGRGNVWGIDFHYYTNPPRGDFGQGQAQKQMTSPASATNFTESTYFGTMRNALRMEQLIRGHDSVMTKYDPQKRIALVVGEWGIWCDPEPGTNPRFLYQQNSLRDALIAGSTLNIFNNHCDRVKMAQLAQTVNVLQALILTEGPKMILTPTYHVFDMYKVHHDSKMLPVSFKSPYYVLEGQSLPALNASASQDSTGIVHITLVNIDPNNTINISITLNQVKWSTVTGQILTSTKITDINTFDKPNTVVIQKFSGARKQGDLLNVTMPSKSVVMLELK